LNKDNFNYLILYATNLFGFSKQSNTLKDTWFDTHKNYINSLKSNNYKDWDWGFLKTSSEPFQAIACDLNSNKPFITHQPILLDASPSKSRICR
jgi:DNA-directed RNA polymerase